MEKDGYLTMDKFKEIKATFRVKSKVGVYDYKFVIERKHSACFKYGDQSCHLLKIYDFKDNRFLRDDYYDTRYDRIDTNKEEWIKEWKDYIKRNWQLKPNVELLEYEEREVTL